MDAEIIAVGSELLTPQHTDTNSLYLTERLNSLGILVRFKTIVGDSKEDLAAVFRTALARSPLIMLTGGLGPTEDDLTRDVVAEVLGRPLHEVAEIAPAHRGTLCAPGPPHAGKQPAASPGAGGRRVAGKPQRHGAGNLDRTPRQHRGAVAGPAARTRTLV